MEPGPERIAEPARRLGSRAMQALRERDVCAIEPGLTDAEFDRIEREFDFRFADDHRAFLAEGLPVNTSPRPLEPGSWSVHRKPWPDWRHGSPDVLLGALDWPAEGVLYDVGQGFWHPTWGPRPDGPDEPEATARRMLADVPRMIPVYGHRYLPAGRGSFGHPVLSMWQTDIICYGADLEDYISAEFGGPEPGAKRESAPTVEFWRDFVSGAAAPS